MNRYLLPVVALFASHASAQQLERWGYPDPDEFAKATYALCAEQNKSVMLAARYKDQGKSKEQVLALVPDNPPSLALRAVDVYRENIEDVFDFPEIGVYPLMAFRSEVCRIEVQSARRPGRFSAVKEKVAACQSIHGSNQSDAIYRCVRNVVRGM